MITSDQPRYFAPADVTVAVSSCNDGTMSFSSGQTNDVTMNRQFFLDKLAIDPLQTAIVQVTYDTTDFKRYRVIDDDQLGEGMLSPVVVGSADALVATRPGQALFLPLADCAGAVLYDTENRVLMLSHLGRHSIELNGAAESVNFLKNQFDSDPSQVQVWLSPAVGPGSYPLQKFSGRGLHDVITEQLLSAGVQIHNIEVSNVDTAKSSDYFSHSEYLSGERDEDGRFAITAVMHE